MSRTLLNDRAAISEEVSRNLLDSRGAAFLWRPGVDLAGYPLRIDLGLTGKAALALGNGAADWAYMVDGFCSMHDLPRPTLVTRKVFETGQPIELPRSIEVPDEETAVAVAGRAAAREKDKRDSRRQDYAAWGFPEDPRDEVLLASRGFSDLDFHLLLRAAGWFRRNDVSGLSPREVPVVGVQGKFLDSKVNRELIARICRRETLGLRLKSNVVQLKYLDPSSPVRFGGCRPDGQRGADEGRPPFAARIAIVVENHATFLDFPLLDGAVCIYGAGRAAVSRDHAAGIPWLRDADRVVYWGDMDADGLEILAGFRREVGEVSSILMDTSSFEEYAEAGTSLMPNGKPVPIHAKKVVPGLAPPEQALYDALADTELPCRRIEQERIPYSAALEALDSLG